MSSNPNDADFDPEDRRKHLDHVQAVIARLAGASTTAKGWSLTIAAAAFGFSSFNKAWYVSLLGLAVVASFSVLDMYYLYEERLFRRLHKAVREGTAPSFSMYKDDYKNEVDSRLETYFSWSVFGFYVPLTLTGITVVGIGLAFG